jgi:TonB-linked SusC/RagA family outer membrane protein
MIKKLLSNQQISRRKKISFVCLFVLFSIPFGTFARDGGLKPVKDAVTSRFTAAPSEFKKTKVDAIPIDGKVTDQTTGQSLAGVSVTIKGSNVGTSTDANGAFNINASTGNTLVFTFVGYESLEAKIGATTHFEISLVPKANQLNAVVVTALGIKRSEKSLSYASQQVAGDELTKVKTDNLMNALSGKVAGVSISANASGLGGSVKVILRGNKSAAGTNQPLYVIDGIPLANNSNANGQPNSPGSTGNVPDGGDGISNLNPDDIESINVLSGASASALYGSQASNGVILITTKKGKAGKTQITFSSSASLSQAAYLPEFQNEYGQTSPGATQSWGAKINGATDNVKSFFKTGNDYTNSISISSGNEAAQTYFSYANTTASGIQPGNKLARNNFYLRETSKILNNKLTLDGSANYVNQKINNTPITITSFNALPGLYLFPRGLDISNYRNNFEVPDSSRGGLMTQNWPFSEAIQQNPWWVVNRGPNVATRNRIILSFTAKYEINKWFSIQARANVDRSTDTYEQDAFAGTSLSLINSKNGQLVANSQASQQIYSDVLAIFKIPTKSDFKINAIVGSSINDQTKQGYSFGPGLGLFIPNVFIMQNVALQNQSTVTVAPSTSATPVSLQSIGSNASTIPTGRNQIQSIFASGDISYKDYLFLTLSGRNDWSSNLSFTPNGSYFYPAIGLSYVLSQSVKLPDAINYAKLRASYAQVGNTVGTYATNPLNRLGAGGSVINNGVAPLPILKPEQSNSYEYGTDWGFFNNRLTLNLTYYKTNTINQFFQIIPPATTGYTTGFINAGNIQNSGIEIVLGYSLLKNKNFSWNTTVNYSHNKNLIKDVDSKDGIDQFLLTAPVQNYESAITKGGSFGDIYGYKIATDSLGRVKIGSSGLPSLAASSKYGQFYNLGNPNPKFQLGWSNSFKYKNLSLNILVDGRFGGEIYSLTQANLDKYGVSKASGDARDAGGVKIDGVDPNGNAVTTIDAQKWYSIASQTVGEYIYSATVVRLREASLGYSFPIKNSFAKNLTLSLTGRNLFYFYKKAPSDPEQTISSGNGLSGLDNFNQPALRSYGVNLNVVF